MSKVKYIDKKFSEGSMFIIDQANEIIDEYVSHGLDLTLRQLYYQFVSRDLIENKQSEYKRLGSIINDGRLAGLIDWNAIEDRTRNLRGNTHWRDPGEIIHAASKGFRVDYWRGQSYRPEVWIEKEALVGVISSICHKLDVDFFACKGYVSQSEMWSSAQRFHRYSTYRFQIPVIIYLGDHDPSGIDMTRDIEDRQKLFNPSISVEVKRIALNMDQIEEYNPPPNPVKVTDSRHSGYAKEYGDNSWELDALDPLVLIDLVENAVLLYRNEDIFKTVLEKENEYKAILKKVADNWETL